MNFALMACTTCMQNAGGREVNAVNWGILTMILITYGLLFGFCLFFVYLGKRGSL